MIQKLMESFDIDASKLAGFSTFDVGTLTVMTKYRDVDGQLDDLEAGFEIDQWAANLDKVDGTRMSVSGHKEKLAQTLRDWVDDVDDANRSGPSCRTNFMGSTGNSTNNSDAMIRQHTLRDKAIRKIDPVNKKYTLESSLSKTRGKWQLS
jgi:hypothetical protein